MKRRRPMSRWPKTIRRYALRTVSEEEEPSGLSPIGQCNNAFPLFLFFLTRYAKKAKKAKKKTFSMTVEKKLRRKTRTMGRSRFVILRKHSDHNVSKNEIPVESRLRDYRFPRYRDVVRLLRRRFRRVSFVTFRRYNDVPPLPRRHFVIIEKCDGYVSRIFPGNSQWPG